jgi:hypothetical protein
MVGLRNPVKKWADRKFSDKRLKAIKKYRHDPELANTHMSIIQEAEDILSGNAESYLSRENLRQSTIIFPGTAMRPLFEAVRAINEVRKVIPRDRIRYLVTPSRKGTILRGKKMVRATDLPGIDRHGITLAKLPKIKGKQAVVVDYADDGITAQWIRQAVKSRRNIRTYLHEGGYGVYNAQYMSRPINKDPEGNIPPKPEYGIGPVSKEKQDKYLLFSRRLQRHVDKIKAELGKN